jgi:hypothetical protein
MTEILGAEVEPFTLHDLRCSAATGMPALEITPHVVDKILNHSSGKIAGVARVWVYNSKSLSAAGVPPHQIATRVGVSRVTVNLWCQGFLAKRLGGLEDAAGRGRKPSVPVEAVRVVLDKAVTP